MPHYEETPAAVQMDPIYGRGLGDAQKMHHHRPSDPTMLATKEGGISDRLNEQSKLIAGLEDEVNNLKDALIGMLGPLPPTAATKNDGRLAASPVASSLGSHNHRLAELMLAIRELRMGLDL